jgi:hypothetical protein
MPVIVSASLGQTNACQNSETMSVFLEIEILEERAQLATSSGECNPFAFVRSSRAAGPDKGRVLVERAARAEPKLFELEEPHARKPRNEKALKSLKTNNPAKSLIQRS